MSEVPETPLLSYSQLLVLLRVEFARARRYQYPLSCLTLQLDRLNELESELGPDAVRERQSRLVDLVRDETRACDAVAFYDGRLSVILPHTDAEGVLILGERLRARVPATVSAPGSSAPMSVSIGVASVEGRETLFFDSIWRSAQLALELAQRHGGDRVSRPPEAPPQPTVPEDD